MTSTTETSACAWCETQTPETELVVVAEIESDFHPATDALWCTACCADHLTHEMTYLAPDEFLPQAS